MTKLAQFGRCGILSLALVLAACGDDDPASVSTNTSSQPGTTTVTRTNARPTISGNPATKIAHGAPYVFAPSATDPDGDALVFGIDAKPAWAAFDTKSGQLKGTPKATDVGTYTAIVIWVSDGALQTQLPKFDLVVNAAPVGNRAPTISGTPSNAVLPGSLYSFQPAVADPDGGTLTFSITNKPAWATFSASTGLLRGTPGAGDIGTMSGIVIRVSDGALSAALAPFSVTVQAFATGSATLSWTPPTQNSDGSPLTNLSGYKVYWGTTQGSYPNSVTLNNAGLTSYVVDNLVPGKYFFAAKALSSVGAESDFSGEATKTIL